MATRQDFVNALDRYYWNLAEYKTTGSAAIKTAVDRDKMFLDQYLEYMNTRVTGQQNEIRTFMNNYEKANPELLQMQQELKQIQTEGPKLQDIYETEKKAQEEEPIDYSPYYVKAGLIVGVGALIALVSAFRPVYTI